MFSASQRSGCGLLTQWWGSKGITLVVWEEKSSGMDALHKCADNGSDLLVPLCSYQQHELAENAKENAGALVLLVTVQKRSRWEVWLFVYKQGEILPETQCNLMGEARVSQWESATWVCLPFCWRIPRILGRNWVVLSSLVRFGGIVSSDAFAVTLFYHWFHFCVISTPFW